MTAGERWQAPPRDTALRWILLSNGLALLLAAGGEGGFISLLWIYWCQSVVIGWFARKRMLALQRFSTEGLRINDEAVAPTPETQTKTANFFALHYGFFHVGYVVFLTTFTAGAGPVALGHLDALGWFFVAVAAASFWHTHHGSHQEHVAADLARLPNLGTLMVLPYARVVPMHLTIIVGSAMGAGRGLLLFGVLKTAADVVMHKVEHRWLQGDHRRQDDHRGRG